MGMECRKNGQGKATGGRKEEELELRK